MTRLPTYKIVLTLILSVSLASPAQGMAQDGLRTDHVLYFAAGWRVSKPAPQNVLQLGALFRCGTDWCMEYEEFYGKDNLPRFPLSYRHEMDTPYGTGRCTNEQVTTIHGVIRRDVPVQITDEERGFVLRAGSDEYTWERDTSPAGGFVLLNAREAGSNGVFEQPVGFAYESEDQRGRQIKSTDLSSYFDGQIAHKDTLMGAMDDWAQKQSSIDFRKFTSSSAQPLMGWDIPALPDVVRYYKKPMMWVHHTVLTPQTGSGRLNYIFHEYGHDFNANGCFDEFGHNKLLLPAFRSDLISAFVYIEYTPDTRDGVPMISVGRYYRKQ